MSKYRIQQGDSFWSIANTGMSVTNLKDLAKYINQPNVPTYILPADNRNRFFIRNDQLQFKSHDIQKTPSYNTIVSKPKNNSSPDYRSKFYTYPSYLRQVKQNMKRFYKGGGAIPIGTQKQYNNVVSIYQSLVSKGVPPQAALEIVNQKVAEKGWAGFATGDNKKYFNADDFADHIIDWHGRMYPDSLKAKSFEDYWKGIQITPKYKYNSENPNYKQELLKTRSGVKKRINFYRQQQGLNPLAYIPTPDIENINIT